MLWSLCSILREQTEIFRVSYFDFTPNQSLRERMEIEEATRAGERMDRSGPGGSREEEWVDSKCFVKSIQEGSATD